MALHNAVCLRDDNSSQRVGPQWQLLVATNNHQCLIGNSSYWRVHESEREKHIKIAGRLQCNSGWALVDGAKKGLGIVQLPDYYIDNELNSGELVPILTSYQPKQEGVWGIYPPRQFVATNVRVLLDYLVAGLKE